MAHTLLNSVCRAMERIAPIRLAESWDNVRKLFDINYRTAKSPVQTTNKRVLLTIDLTPSVLKEAIEMNTSVIVSYHPPIFKGLQALTCSNPLQSSLLQCAAQGISIYSPHTALDSVSGGINDWLAEGVLAGSTGGKVMSLVRDKLSPQGDVEGGEGRLVTLDSPIEMETLIGRIKNHLQLSQIQIGPPSSASSVNTVAICAGSGGSMLAGNKADVYFTGEMSHHEVLTAIASGKHVILCGHTNTERGYLTVLASKLRDELKRDESLESGAEVAVSQSDQHPLQIV